MKEIVIAIIGSGALSTAVAAIVSWLSTKGRIRDAVRGSLYFQIRQTGLECIREGKIDAPTLEAICKAHDTYEKLGGNGYIDSIMDRVNKLPIRDE